MHLLASDDDGCAAQEVTCGNDAVFSQYEHRARALNLLIDAVDTVYEAVAHVDEQGHHLGLVQLICALLAQVHTLCQQLIGNLAQVVDLRHRHNGIAPQVRVDDDGLRVGVADDAQALMSAEIAQFILELRAEVVAFQRVDAAGKALLGVEGDKTGAARAKM